jgi:hypothetical protein
VGQRDSSGSGTAGYRILPRDPADVLSVRKEAEPSPSGQQPAGVITIAAARALAKNAAARVRGTVTMPPGIVDPTTAVIQDATGAIVLRIGEEVGSLSRGEVVTVDGVRSTKGGMETLRISVAPTRAGHATEPPPRELRTGSAGEDAEAQLVVVRGALVAAARRSSSGTISFELDDGSGALRVSIGASVAADRESLAAGTWLQVTGILGQETTGAQPLRGYRIWPRAAVDLRVLATPTDVASTSGTGTASGDVAGPAAGLDAIGGPAGDSVRIGATLVSGAWPELDIGGLLWDGRRLVALDASAAQAIDAVLDGSRPPRSVELSGLQAVGVLDELAMPVVRLGDEPDSLLPGGAPPAAPATFLPEGEDAARWVAVVGRLSRSGSAVRLRLDASRAIDLDVRCTRTLEVLGGVVGVIGVAASDPSRVVVPCGGIRPAPDLDRAGAAVAAAGVPAANARVAGLIGGAGVLRPPAIGSAALLGLAATGLAAGAFMTRRIRSDDPDDPDPAIPSPGEEPDHAQAPPTLTLVPLPRDRAP